MALFSLSLAEMHLEVAEDQFQLPKLQETFGWVTERQLSRAGPLYHEDIRAGIEHELNMCSTCLLQLGNDMRGGPGCCKFR